jgi:hypothetical protein
MTPATEQRQPTMMTLNEINATMTQQPWHKGRFNGQYDMMPGYAVGFAGQQNGYRGGTGEKRHLLRIETVVADYRTDDVKEADRKNYRGKCITIGSLSSVHGCVTSHGQFTGRVIAGLDTDAITCKRCQKELANVIARAEASVRIAEADAIAARDNANTADAHWCGWL